MVPWILLLPVCLMIFQGFFLAFLLVSKLSWRQAEEETREDRKLKKVKKENVTITTTHEMWTCYVKTKINFYLI